MLPESLAPSLREQLSRARAWWLKDQAEGRSGAALPDALSGSIRMPAFLAVVLGFCAAHAFDRSTERCRRVAITCMTRPFSAPSNVP